MTKEQNTNAALKDLRSQLDAIDIRIVRDIAERLAMCAEIGKIKRNASIPMMQENRVTYVREAFVRSGAEVGLTPDFMIAIASLIIEEACRMEDDIINRPQDTDGDESRDGAITFSGP